MFNNKTRAEKHQERSNNAFNVFKKTVTELELSNKSIEEDIAIEDNIIKVATESKNEMTIIKDGNQKFINKINKFFELN